MTDSEIRRRFAKVEMALTTALCLIGVLCGLHLLIWLD